MQALLKPICRLVTPNHRRLVGSAWITGKQDIDGFWPGSQLPTSQLEPWDQFAFERENAFRTRFNDFR